MAEEHSLRHPDMRACVVDYLRDFADDVHVLHAWARGEVDYNGPIDSYENALVELHNSLGVYPDPSEAIGWSLRSEKEAAALSVFFAALDEFWERYPGLTLTELRC